MFALLFVPLAVLLLSVVWGMFLFVFPTYAIVLTLFLGPLGFIASFLSTLHLSRKIVSLVLKLILFPRFQSVMFDAILSREGLYDVVHCHNIMKEQSKRNFDLPSLLLTKFLPTFAAELTLLVVQFIPILGPLIILVARAPAKAYEIHERYFTLMRWDDQQKNKCYWHFRLEYIQFGLMALVLELIPGLTFFFMFTSNVGMALWSVDNHEKLGEIGRPTSSHGPIMKEPTAQDLPDLSETENPNVEIIANEVKKREYLKLPINSVKSRIWNAKTTLAD